MIKGFSQYINEQYNNTSETIDLKYGNPLKWQKEAMNAGSTLYRNVKDTEVWQRWIAQIPPRQDSEELIKSIQDLIMLGNSLNQEDLDFIEECENDIHGVYIKFLNQNGIDTIKKEDLKNISKELNPITFALKYHFNYPRPLQLALELNLPLYPTQSTDACSPSYPSGHAIDSHTIAEVIAKKIPQLRDEIRKLGERISFSRNQGGIHYDFDSNFGKEIAMDIISLDLISL